jgi:integrase
MLKFKQKQSATLLAVLSWPPLVEPDAMQTRPARQEFSLYSRDGKRKYLNHAERQRALAEMEKLPRDQALMCLTLAWTGARISEVLSLSASSFMPDCGVVSIRTLKRRKPHVREVPIPPELMKALERHYRIAAAQRDPLRAASRLWQQHRGTAYKIIKRVMARAGIVGIHACPKALRHAFAIAAVRCVPVTLVKKWLGHARLSTTEIYLDVCGEDEIEFAARLWQSP